MGIQVKGIGHIGILVSDFERSFKFYTETMGCKVTNRRKGADGRETAFLRFNENHHDFVIGTAPEWGRRYLCARRGPVDSADRFQIGRAHV